MTFRSILVEGGGKLLIESSGEGMILNGSFIHIQSGGVMEVDKAAIHVENITIDNSGILHADHKVNYNDFSMRSEL